MAIQRREFIQWMIAFGVAPEALWAQKDDRKPPPPGPVPWMEGINHADPKALTATNAESVAQGELRFFTPRQMDTLVHLSDVLLPSLDGFPAATDAGTPMFLDFLLSESSSSRKQLYKGGLDWLDQQAALRYKVPFAKVTETQADALLRPWLRTWMVDHLPVEPHADFVNTVHYDLRIATENSSAWTGAVESAEGTPREQLYWSPVEPDVNTPSPFATPAHITQPVAARRQVAR